MATATAEKNTETIIGTYVGDRARREDWCTGTISTGATVKGIADPADLRRGVCYEFFGQWEEHPKFGRQFSFVGFVERRAPGRTGIVEYLSRSCAGIGPAIAGQLYDLFGEEAAAKLREDPAGCAASCAKLASDVAAAAAETLKGLQKFEVARIDLIELFAGRGLPRNSIDVLIKKWGPSAPRIVRSNPYSLMSLAGCGFKRADQLYIDLKKPPGRLKRQALCAWHALDSDSDGNTWFPYQFAKDAILEEIGTQHAKPTRALALAVRAGLIAQYQDEAGAVWVSNRERARNEALIAAKLAELQNTPNIWPQDVAGVSEHQSEGLYRATLGPVGCLVGSPGTGKTFALAALIRRIVEGDAAAKGYDEITADAFSECESIWNSGRPADLQATIDRKLSVYRPIYICAPTGKAAVRATEAMVRNGLAFKAKTVHGTLGMIPSKGGGLSYRYTAANPLPNGYLIIDESSMLDTDLAAALLAACKPGMHVLFVGDTHQLAPVGHGAPLRDMIAAGLPVGVLCKIERNVGTIVRVCAAIKDGGRFIPDATLALPSNNLVHRERPHEATQITELKRVIEELRREGKYDLLRDVQILVSVNQKSKLSRVELNKLLQPILNPNAPPFDDIKWRNGDKVICLKNNYFKAVGDVGEVAFEANPFDKDDDGDKAPEHWIANGEIGYVDDVQKAHLVVTFDSPMRTVRVPTRGEDAHKIDLAYAITTHKSQGSEFSVVIVMIDGSNVANRIGTRELIYTAISRAREWCMTIGETRTIDRQTRVIGLDKRKTFLAEFAREKLAALLADVEGF